MQKSSLFIVALVSLLSAPAFAGQSLSASFIDSKGEKIGTATLQEMGNGTLISVDLNLPAGVHAMHIHEKGACDAPDFKTAGGHFNPQGHQHGFNNPEGFHEGDLANLYVESTGHIKVDVFSTRVHLSGKDGLGNGTAIVIHDKADDYMSDPSGNSGPRIACAVVKG